MKMLTIAFALFCNFSFAEMGPQPSKTTGGRFQLIQLSSARRDQFMIDTQTGKIWSKVCLSGGTPDGGCDLDAWALDNVEGINISRDELAKMQKASKGQ